MAVAAHESFLYAVYLAQGVGQAALALVLAAILSAFHRVYARRYLRYWTLGWLALVVYIAAFLGMRWLPGQTALTRGALGAIALVSAYLQIAWLVLGARGLASGVDPTPGLVRAVVGAAIVAGLASAGPTWVFGRVAIRCLVAGVAYLWTAVMLSRGGQRPSVGRSATRLALVLYAADQLAYFAQIFLPPRQDETIILLAVFDTLATAVMGIALVAWLLEEERERVQRLMQNSSDVIAVLDEQGVQRSVNGPSERILGYRPEDLVGKNAFDSIHPEDVDAARRAFSHALRVPNSVSRTEFRNRHKNGSWVKVEAVGTSRLQDPILHGVVVNVRDLTERTILQEQLQQAMKMEAVGRLAGGVAHDFNNLLTVIVGNAELGRIDLDPSDPRASEFAEIGRAAQSAAALTRQLLAFSRRQVIQPIVLNLNDLIRNLERMLGRLIGENVAVQTVLDEGLRSVRIDPGQVEQILVNLAVNARDAMPDGGQLIIETRNVTLDEHYAALHPDVSPGPRVLLSVADTGHGMSEEVKRRLFEPFFTTKIEGRGTGLGLATILGAVKQAGGHIEVYSEPGLGATFKIYLPSTEAPAEQRGSESHPALPPKGSETVLLVEDDARVRELVRTMLERQGYRVLQAPSGREALQVAERHRKRIDLLMTDVVMPGMSGRELSRRLAAIFPTLKVLFTSGYAEHVIVHHGVVDSGLSFIAKPFTLQDLAVKVRAVLDSADAPN